MVYECIFCGLNWVDSLDISDEKDGLVSSGCCPICFKTYQELIWRRQSREGYSSCFNRGYENCTEESCAFRFSCLEINIEKWKETIINQGD